MKDSSPATPAVRVFVAVLVALPLLVQAQVQTGPAVPANDPVAVPRQILPAQPVQLADPASGDPVAEEPPPRAPIVAAPVEGLPMEADAVEIPVAALAITAEDEEDEEEEEAVAVEMAIEAAVEEEVDAADSTVNKIDNAPGAAPTSADDLRARSTPDQPGQVGSSILTRTEARTFTFSIPAPRGQILDRNGYPLAQSKVSYYAAIGFPFLGKDVTDEQILQYAGERIIHVNNILGKDWDLAGKTVIDHYRDRRWVPLTFSSVLTGVEIDELNRQQMEGLVLQPVYLRHYPQNETLAHVIGYVGKRPPRIKGPVVTDEPLWGEGLGADGLEETYETDLRGTPGQVNILFEADGTKVKEDLLSRPKPGYNLVTSIDLEMQRICERLLSENMKRGAMVIMDTRNGDVLAMASFPRFNPNDFIPSISREKYSELVSDPEKPLFPRAYRAAYPPASTFKVPVALGFLDSGFLSARDLYSCPSSYQIGDLVMRNWNADGEGAMNVVGAIARSCNTWFYQVAINGGADTMSSMAMRLGLGIETGIPLKEDAGFIPSNRWWISNLGYAMSDGDEAVMSIGQGKVETTPLQVARMMAAIGNGQKVLKPRLVLQVQDLNHELIRTFPTEVQSNLYVDPYSLSVVRMGMYEVVHGGRGTGRQAAHRITVAGKTGTGQWKPAQEQNIAWFAGFAPAKHPIYSFAVIYEGDPGEKVSGGRNAAPIIGQFFEEYLADEEKYTAVAGLSRAMAEEAGDLQEYTAAPVPSSIFRDSETESELEEAARLEQEAMEAAARERQGASPERRGGLRRLFGRKNRQ